MRHLALALPLVISLLGTGRGGCAGGEPDTEPADEPAPTAAATPAPTSEASAENGSGSEGTSEGSEDGASWETAGWQALLDTYVVPDGFRYEALRDNAEHTELLAELVADIAATDHSSWSREAKLAFLMNAYNVLTIHSVLRDWPVESVLSEDGFFDGQTHTVSGAETTLNDLENVQIRAAFGEPRIHFLVNCASVGCPRLVEEAITPANLERLLEAQAVEYIRSGSRLDRAGNKVEVSQIFNWFADDFTAGGGVRPFLAARLEGEDAAFVADEGTAIEFFEYDWNLNGR